MNSGDSFDAGILDLTIKGGMGGDQAIKELIRIFRCDAITNDGLFLWFIIIKKYAGK